MEKIKLKNVLFVITYTVVLLIVLNNFTAVRTTLGSWFGLIVPFIYGFGIAYILNIPFVFFKDKVFAFLENKGDLQKKLIIPFALISTYLSVLIALSLIIWFIIPQLGSSISLLVKNIPSYMISLEEFTNDLIDKYNLESLIGSQTDSTWTNLLKQAASTLSNLLLGIANYIVSLTSSIYNWFIGITVSIYLLAGKDNLLNQSKRILKAFLSDKKYDMALEISSRTNGVFNSFIKGSLLDSLIVGIICFIGSSILGIKFALLVSVIQAITNIIPVFGPIIGGVPSTFIILMVDPIKALIFVIFIFVLQQIDGNIIQPRIVGGSIGLPGIWVLFAIVVGSGLFGIAGLLLGVPAAAVMYSVFKEYVNKRLEKKEGIGKEAEG